MKNFAITTLLLIFALGCTEKNASEKNVVVSVLEANISTIDPIHSTNKYASTITASIYEGLYHYHYLKRPMEVEPALAEGMPTISEEGTLYTIKLKKDVFFQDDKAFPDGKGREFVANDVIYSWKRLADPKNKALGWWIFDGIIEGLNQWRDDLRDGKATYDTPVSGLKALDPHTLQIKLTRQSFQFIHFLATPITLIVPHEAIKKYGKDFVNNPVGTGPFVMKKWVRNSEVVLAKNPTYRKSFYPLTGEPESKARGHLKHGGKPLPLADEVIVRIIGEKQPLWLSFLRGELDHGILPKDNYDQVFENNKIKKSYTDKGIRIHYVPRPDVTYIAFNMEHPILGKHKELRQAFAASIDKASILKSFYNNRGIVAHSTIPPNLDGYDPDYKNPIAFDLKKARELMAKAGFPEGKGLPTLDYQMASTTTWSRQYGELLKDLWSKIGIKIKLHANTYPQFDKKIKTKKATMFDHAWMADYPDTENFMQMFYSKNISPGSNNFNYVNREYDTLYEKLVSMGPGSERDKLLRQMVDIINEDVPAIFVVHRIFRQPYHGWLDNYNEYPIIYDHLQYLFVDKEKKAKLIKKL